MRLTGTRHRLHYLWLQGALGYPLLLGALELIHTLTPQRAGVVALTAIFAPYLYLPLVLLLPVVVRYRSRSLLLALVVCAVVFSVRFGPTLISVAPLRSPADGHAVAAPTMTALTWNLRAGNHQIAAIVEELTQAPVAIAALQELSEAERAGIAASDAVAQRYPYQVLKPHPNQPSSARGEGLGVLSRYPILDQGVLTTPAAIWARLDLGHGQRLMVINATVPPARITLPAYNPRERDEQIRQLRTLIDPILQHAEPLLVLGDFNVTQHEVAYHELTAGLQDTHLRVGRGFGNSWRPPFLVRLPLPLLRIDYLFNSPVVRPRSIETDCTLHRSDHCIVRGRFELEAR